MLFFYGFLVGLVVASIALIVVGNLIAKEHSKNIDSTMKDIELIGSIKYRFVKVNEITERQIELASRANRPSASAAHSRSKNNIIGELKALEEEKIEIFRSILKDGIDPNLKMIIDGEPQLMRMSEAVSIHEGNSPSTPVKKTDSIKPRNNGLHLVTISEDNNESGNPKVP